MKYLLALLLSAIVYSCMAQKDYELAASYFKQAELASKKQRLWKIDLYGPTLLVEPNSRTTYANEQDSAGILKPYGGVFVGTLPKGVMIANTSMQWQSKMWSVILWPLPTDRDERLNLMLHESFHRIQQSLGFFNDSPTAEHLGTLQGRIYFLLELQALRAALTKPVAERTLDLKNALRLRQKRQDLFPSTFANEQILEISEGLAEFTGMVLGRKKNNIRQHLLHQIDTAANRKSLIRSSAYLTGPIYGYLLFEKDQHWTRLVDSTANFPSLLKKVYATEIPAKLTAQDLSLAEKLYQSDKLILSETEKENKRLELAKSYNELFTQRPVLVIKLIKMGIQFNPNNLMDLGKLGTVYPTAEIKDEWGTLSVKNQGMLMKNWQLVYLPMEGFSQNDGTIKGSGWEIALSKGWTMIKIDNLHYQLVKP